MTAPSPLDAALSEIRGLSEQIARLVELLADTAGPADPVVVNKIVDLTDRRRAAEARFDAALAEATP